MSLVVDVTRLSPNYSPGQPSGRKVVVHATRSGVSLNPSEFEGTLNWFSRTSSQVSAHGLIGRDGRIARIVPDDKTAWHAGQHNPEAWGWELEQGVESDGFTIKQMESWAVVARHYVMEFGVQPQHIRGMSKSGFIGHEETPQGISVGKSDPGYKFMWQAFIISLQEDEMNDEDKQWVREEIVKYLSTAGGGHLPNLITAKVLDGRINDLITRKHRSDPHGGGDHVHEATVSSKVTLA